MAGWLYYSPSHTVALFSNNSFLSLKYYYSQLHRKFCLYHINLQNIASISLDELAIVVPDLMLLNS